MPKEDKKDLFKLIYEVVKLIPKGRVTNYGAIAKYLGTGKSSRLVGWAMNASHNLTETIPAHRVVNRNGLLTGKSHFPGPDTMQKLLEEEGLTIVENQIQNFKSVYWDPNKELSL